MDWYTYAPTIAAILLAMFSGFPSRVLKKMVSDFHTENAAVQESKPFIEAVALDWATRIGFYNSTVTASLSCLLTYARTKSGIALTVFLILGGLLCVLYWWISTHSIGDLVALKTFRNIPDSMICRCVLILLYVTILIVSLVS